MADSVTFYSINGRIVPESEALIPVTDRGFLYGDGVFETLHAYGRALFKLEAHLQRLHEGAGALYFKPSPKTLPLARWMRELVAAADFSEANVRLTVTRGCGARGPSIAGAFKMNVVLTATRFERPAESVLQAGVSAIVSSVRRQESAATAKLKTLNYIEQILAKREADAAGVSEALLLNNAGLLCEGSASNISLIREGALVVPDPELAGALPGIAQLTAMQAARNLGIPVRLTCLSPWDPGRSDEAFLSGSMREIAPLVRVGDATIGNGKPGPVTLKIVGEFRRLVEKECAPFRY